MNHCLICGAKSWGPVAAGATVVMGDTMLDSGNFSPDQFKRCDACGAWANTQWLELPPLKEDANFMAAGPVPFGLDAMMQSRVQSDNSVTDMVNYAKEMIDKMMAQKETRFERITRTLIESLPYGDYGRDDLWAFRIVQTAVSICDEMSKHE